MSTSTKAPTVRELRRSAKSLGVDGWEEMDEAALTTAVSKASAKSAKANSTRKGAAVKKAAATKAAPAKAAKKGAAPKADAPVAENGNPFKEGTNMFLITEELIKGGKRSVMVTRLNKKIELAPRSKDAKDFDVEYEMDRRILITGQHLRNTYGFEVTRDGRGADAVIKAVAP